jgi:hypothetical protein
VAKAHVTQHNITEGGAKDHDLVGFVMRSDYLLIDVSPEQDRFFPTGTGGHYVQVLQLMMI